MMFDQQRVLLERAQWQIKQLEERVKWSTLERQSLMCQVRDLEEKIRRQDDRYSRLQVTHDRLLKRRKQ